MIVAVTGATGYVGRFIVKRLVEEGVKVRAWRRPSSDLTGFPKDIEWIDGDLSSPESARTLVDGADVLVHAALDHVPGRYRGGEGDDPARFRKTNIDGSLALLAAARSAGVSRAVVLSSRAVFGASTKVDRRRRPASPDTEYGAAKAALEAFVQKIRAPRAGRSPHSDRRESTELLTPVERSKWFELVNELIDGVAVAAESRNRGAWRRRGERHVGAALRSGEDSPAAASIAATSSSRTATSSGWCTSSQAYPARCRKQAISPKASCARTRWQRLASHLAAGRSSRKPSPRWSRECESRARR